MIPKDYITAWRSQAPWIRDEQVEQDLVISRALVDIFSVPAVTDALAFRGGTALHKLYFDPPGRYSEDIDLVQVRAEPIGDTLDLIRQVLDPWLGEPRRVFKEGRVKLVYRFFAEGPTPMKMRLKVEINTREHFTQLGHIQMPFSVESPWFNGRAEIKTFRIDEVLGTKLRALYQRKKGRDLFDLWLALEHGLVNPDTLVECFESYMAEGGHATSRAQFEANLESKRQATAFRTDVGPLLRTSQAWHFDNAVEIVLRRIIGRLPGPGWKGEPGKS